MKKKERNDDFEHYYAFLGVFSMVLGPEMALALDAAISVAGLVGTWAIDGNISTTDIITGLVGVFAGRIRGVTGGLKLDEIVNNFRFARTLTSHVGLMKDFSHYTDSMSELYGAVYSTAQA